MAELLVAMKGVRLLRGLLLAPVVLVSSAKQHLRQVGLASQNSIGGATSAHGASALEEEYGLLESTLLRSDEEAERSILRHMRRTAERMDASGTADTVTLDLLGASAALAGLAGRDPSGNNTRDVFVNNMKDLVDELQDHIHSSIHPHQEYLDGLYGSFQTCRDELYASLADAGKQNSSVSLGRAAHVRCRSEQAQAKTSLAVCEAAKQDLAKADECTAWPVMQVTSIPDAGSVCSKTAVGETYEAYLRRMKEHWDDELSKYESIKARCSTKAILPAKDCSKEEAGLESKKLECDGVQSTFERGFCDQAVQVNKAWYKYIVCYRAAKSSYEDATQTAKKIVDSKRLNLDASHRIECLLKVFSKKHDAEAALRECKLMDHSSETEKIQVQLQKVPEAETPPPSASIPGDAAFAKEEYVNLASAASAPQTCALPFQLAM